MSTQAAESRKRRVRVQHARNCVFAARRLLQRANGELEHADNVGSVRAYLKQSAVALRELENAVSDLEQVLERE